jgi:ATP-binding cassette subfamily F protein uup
MGDPGFYRCPPEQIAAATTRLKELEEEISTAYARWELLESIESAL